MDAINPLIDFGRQFVLGLYSWCWLFLSDAADLLFGVWKYWGVRDHTLLITFPINYILIPLIATVVAVLLPAAHLMNQVLLSMLTTTDAPGQTQAFTNTVCKHITALISQKLSLSVSTVLNKQSLMLLKGVVGAFLPALGKQLFDGVRCNLTPLQIAT